MTKKVTTGENDSNQDGTIASDPNQDATVTTTTPPPPIVAPERLVHLTYTPEMYRDMLTKDVKERFGMDIVQIETNIAKDKGEEDPSSKESRLQVFGNRK